MKKIKVVTISISLMIVFGLLLGCTQSSTTDKHSNNTGLITCGHENAEHHTEEYWVLTISKEEFDIKYAKTYFETINEYYEDHNYFVDLKLLSVFINETFPGLFKEYLGDPKLLGDLVGAKTCCSSNQFCAKPCKCRDIIPNFNCSVRLEYDGPITAPED